MVLVWVDTARDDSAEGCPVLEQGLISLSSAGDHSHVERPQHFCVGSNERKVQTGSILAGDLSFFWDCDKMELMNQGDFIESLGGDA